MERSGWVVAAASAAAWIALAAVGVRWRGQAERERDGLEERLAALSAQPDEPAPAGGERESDELAGELRELETRLARLESDARRRAVPIEAAAPGPPDGRSAEAEPAAPAGDRTSRPEQAVRDELEALLAEVVADGWSETPEGAAAMERFLALARESGALEEWIAEQEALVAANPGDPELRMDLADLYTGKLLTVGGPEQGVWGSKAEREWQAVVELDDDHLRAHAALGTNYAYYPDVMGKTDDAIRHLERARELQRGLDPAPEHVPVYLFLARMYQRTGDTAKARDVLLEGLASHPGEPDLEEALGQL